MGRPGGFGLTVANAPVAALEASLKLTAAQKAEISKIQKQHQNDRRGLMPRPPAPGGPPPDFGKMREMFGKMMELDKQTSQKIEALLTPDQKKALPGALKDIQTLNAVGIPAELSGTLKLTADQKKQLSAIAEKGQQTMMEKMRGAQQNGNFEGIREMMQENRKQTRDKALAVLTAAQKAQVDKYLKEHPRPQGGPGFGGPGGPPPN